ncbi:MAG: 4Fe-4S dicluster-binding protein [Candidatus Diapherotrites archaeon]
MSTKIIPEEKLDDMGTDGIPYTVAGKGKIPDTGSWKVFRPVVDEKKCIKCWLCWVHCPDTAIKLREDDFVFSDYSICKGCGACAEVCPVKCIAMEKNKPDGKQRSDQA